MNGELILTSYTYDQGRTAINSAFSGTAVFNILSANTFYNPSSLFSSSTGSNSIVANNGTGNIASGNYSFAGGTGSTATDDFSFAYGSGATTFGIGSIALGAALASTPTSNPCIAIGHGAFASASAGSSIAIGNGATATGIGSATAIGQDSIALGVGSMALNGIAVGYFSLALNGGLSNGFKSISEGVGSNSAGDYSKVFSSSEIASGATAFADYSVILGGGDSTINTNAIRSVIIGMSGFTATSADTVYMTNSYVDGYFDLNPITVLPSPKIGRIFFSGTPLNRLMQNTGGTSADWCII